MFSIFFKISVVLRLELDFVIPDCGGQEGHIILAVPVPFSRGTVSLKHKIPFYSDMHAGNINLYPVVMTNWDREEK